MQASACLCATSFVRCCCRCRRYCCRRRCRYCCCDGRTAPYERDSGPAAAATLHAEFATAPTSGKLPWLQQQRQQAMKVAVPGHPSLLCSSCGARLHPECIGSSRAEVEGCNGWACPDVSRGEKERWEGWEAWVHPARHRGRARWAPAHRVDMRLRLSPMAPTVIARTSGLQGSGRCATRWWRCRPTKALLAASDNPI